MHAALSCVFREGLCNEKKSKHELKRQCATYSKCKLQLGGLEKEKVEHQSPKQNQPAPL